jgi:hypothetical protein
LPSSNPPIDAQLPILGPAHALTTHVHDELLLLLVSSLELELELFAARSRCSFLWLALTAVPSAPVPDACSPPRADESDLTGDESDLTGDESDSLPCPDLT